MNRKTFCKVDNDDEDDDNSVEDRSSEYSLSNCDDSTEYLVNSGGPIHLTLIKNRLTYFDSRGTMDIKNIKGPFYLQNKEYKKPIPFGAKMMFLISSKGQESDDDDDDDNDNRFSTSYCRHFSNNHKNVSSSESEPKNSQPLTSEYRLTAKDFASRKLYEEDDDDDDKSSEFSFPNCDDSTEYLVNSDGQIYLALINNGLAYCNSNRIMDFENIKGPFYLQNKDYKRLISFDDKMMFLISSTGQEDDNNDDDDSNNRSSTSYSMNFSSDDENDSSSGVDLRFSSSESEAENFQPSTSSYRFTARDFASRKLYEDDDDDDDVEYEPFKEYEEYERLLALEYESCIPNNQPFDCSICMENIPENEGVILHSCLHEFCRNCLRSIIEHNQEAEIKCPSGEGCEFMLEEREIRQLVSEESFEKYLRQTVKIAEASSTERTYHCKTPNCDGFCYVGNEKSPCSLNVDFHCLICNHRNCIQCEVIHEGMSCQKYKDELAKKADNENIHISEEFLKRMILEGKAMSCPKCSMIIFKVDGCDGMKCIMCQNELCWATKGLRWGPGGKGDISGGCRCRVNNIPCAPNCQNCH